MFTRVTSAKPAQASPAGRQQSTNAAPSFQPLRIQPKLTVGPVDDPFEREADRAAERVVSRLPAGPLGLSALVPTFVQRQEDGAEEEADEKDKPEDAKKIRLKAAGPPPAEPGGGSAPAGVEVGIRRAQGAGRPLPQPVRGAMEGALGADFGAVRVHTGSTPDHLSQALSARAFTVGREIFFRSGEFRPDQKSGQKLLAHELTHAVQQGAAVPRAPGAVHRPGPLVQRQFQGPQFAGGDPVDEEYEGHEFEFNKGPMPETGCGSDNQITTAGEWLTNNKSKPGTPKKMASYRKGFSRPGGLVKDKTLDQAATKMHLINHRLEDTRNTQRNPQNIMLGTKRSNNPIHYQEVERPVIYAVTNHGSQENDMYQEAMDDARKTTDFATKKNKVLFWKDKPSSLALKHNQLAEVYLDKGKDANGVKDKKKKNNGDEKGFALTIDGNTPAANYRHLWLVYRVKANYTGRPDYVQDNIDVERDENDDNNKGSKKKEIAKKIETFENNWADNAFPEDFECEVSYFSATYDLWDGIYYQEDEDHTIDAAQ
ncbi:MAG TPA: DUF4157 domain-containing protein [Thermoanaerobaculia bacterium]|nr:DUF4157 domain-containing protein [Thermoanaerobaculia bacterium]